ncbi:MAG TPA: 30S ribosomal protein S8, partial [Phnomibacter sp.]|nr:30S ribosomal protein S8 [Phnomibacter sp.]
ITSMERVSRPGLRQYSKPGDFKRVMNGLGIAIISTSKGVMTDKEAKAQNVGGEILCHVY